MYVHVRWDSIHFLAVYVISYTGITTLCLVPKCSINDIITRVQVMSSGC